MVVGSPCAAALNVGGVAEKVGARKYTMEHARERPDNPQLSLKSRTPRLSRQRLHRYCREKCWD